VPAGTAAASAGATASTEIMATPGISMTASRVASPPRARSTRSAPATTGLASMAKRRRTTSTGVAFTSCRPPQVKSKIATVVATMSAGVRMTSTSEAAAGAGVGIGVGIGAGTGATGAAATVSTGATVTVSVAAATLVPPVAGTAAGVASSASARSFAATAVAVPPVVAVATVVPGFSVSSRTAPSR
jgi:hypothetical protein